MPTLIQLNFWVINIHIVFILQNKQELHINLKNLFRKQVYFPMHICVNVFLKNFYGSKNKIFQLNIHDNLKYIDTKI